MEHRSFAAAHDRTARARPAGAVQDDAEQNCDHAYEADQVCRELRGCVPVHVLGMTGRREMGHDVREPAKDQDQQADAGQKRKAQELGTDAF
jgi:hypothetical protein